MGNIWLKIKIWTKGILFAIIGIYALLFFLNNSGQPVTVWYWFQQVHQTSMLVLVLVTFLVGVVVTILLRTTFTTIRQIRELRMKNRLSKLERDQADMKAKAAMLQTRTAMSSTPGEKPPTPPFGGAAKS